MHPISAKPIRVVVSCEHGGNHVPRQWADHFHDAAEALESHRGYDPGTLQLGQQLADATGATCVASTVTRLLVDLNRSLGHRQLFSEWAMRTSEDQRRQILSEHYAPHRESVRSLVAAGVAAGEFVMHLSVHSFTPVWEGVPRKVDVGFLYDPRRTTEREFCGGWKRRLESREPQLRCRKNQPYRGVADGLTTYLRRQFAEQSYAGIELEISQAIPLGDAKRWARLRNCLVETFLDQRDAWTWKENSE